MKVTLIVLIICLLLSFSLLMKAYRKIDTLNSSINDWKEQSDYYETKYILLTRKCAILEHSRPIAINQKIIPKGTTQAVKEAMKRAHPDNGGNAEDFDMYRRAYNILTGKEKINV